MTVFPDPPPPTSLRPTHRGGDTVTVPVAALAAAARALAKWNGDQQDEWDEAWQEGAQVALEAAAPHMEDPLRARIEALAERYATAGHVATMRRDVAMTLRAALALDDTADTSEETP